MIFILLKFHKDSLSNFGVINRNFGELLKNSLRIAGDILKNTVEESIARKKLRIGLRQNYLTTHAISYIYDKLIKNADRVFYYCCIFGRKLLMP